MLKPKATWKINDTCDHAIASELATKLKVDPLVAKLLIARGITNEQEAAAFMGTHNDDFHDPFLLLGMDKAVKRIQFALEHNERIRIYGDYDADGVSATSLLMTLFTELEAQVDYYIPHRTNEGYGLNKQAIEHAQKNEITLIITVDNGISANEEIQFAAQLGIDVIITDHHEPPVLLPEAYAIINPRQPSCTYPFKELAGVGVAFKLAHALIGSLPVTLLQLAAIGTVADLMPLLGENRLIVKLGLEHMRQAPLLGIKALIEIAGIQLHDLTEMHIGFNIGPRINAVGRLEDAKAGVKLLTTIQEQEAEHLAHHLDHLNKERQQLVMSITEEAMQMHLERAGEQDDVVFILEQEEWHVGVIGIVASKFVEQFHRPTIILNIDPLTGLAKGSARSIAGFDMFRALTQCQSMLLHYGGHQMAAGLTLQQDQLPHFRKEMNRLAREWLTDEDFVPIIEAELECGIKDLPLECIEEIQSLAPFGLGNPSPSFVFRNLRLHDLRRLGKDKQHLKLLASHETDGVNYTLDAIGFGLGHVAHFISPNARIDLLGDISINEWNGIRKPQLRIQDISISERQVFDWRGGKKTEWFSRLQSASTTNELLSDSASNTRLQSEWQPALLLASSETVLADDIINSNCSLWVMEESGSVSALNASAESMLFAEVEDLILYALPPRLKTLQMILKQAHSVQRLYASFSNDANTSGTLPSRDSFKKVYAELLQLNEWQGQDQRIMQGLQRRTGLSPDMLRFIFGVFRELSFIEKTGTSTYRFVTAPDRRDLSSSESYQKRQYSVEAEDILIYSTTQELAHWLISQLPKSVNV